MLGQPCLKPVLELLLRSHELEETSGRVPLNHLERQPNAAIGAQGF